MLFQTTTTGFGAVMPELTMLQSEVDRCLRLIPIDTSSNAGANAAVTCQLKVVDGLRPFEKQTLLDTEDNQILFQIAHSILAGWRNTGIGSDTDATARRIAARKLGEASVFDAGSAPLAAQALSSAGRLETDNVVKLAIIEGLHRILKTRSQFFPVDNPVRTEAITTLKIFADPDIQPIIDVNVLNAANAALKDLAPEIEIGPAEVTPVPKPRSKFLIPVVATAITAVVATGVLVIVLRRVPTADRLNAPGPLRRRAEAKLRRRTMQQRRTSRLHF